MARCGLITIACFAIACGRVEFESLPADSAAETAPPADSAPPEMDSTMVDSALPVDSAPPEDSAPVVDATPSCIELWAAAPSFGTPVPIDAINTSCETMPRCAEQESFLDIDGLTLYFQSDRGVSADIFRAMRPSVADAFGAPELAVELSSAAREYDFARSEDVWAVTSERDSPCTDIFVSGPPPLAFVRDPNLSSAADEFNLWISPDGLRVYFGSRRGTETVARPCGATEFIYFAERSALDDAFSVPVLLDVDPPASAVANPTLLDEERLIVFNSVTTAGNQLKVARRIDRRSPFGPPTVVPIEGDPSPSHPFVTPDGCELYLNFSVGVRGMDLHVTELVR